MRKYHTNHSLRASKDANLPDSALAWLLILVLLTQRLAVPFGAAQIPLALFFFYASMVVGFWSGRLMVESKRAILFLLGLALITLSYILNGAAGSILSYVYLFVLYIPFVAVLRKDEVSARLASAFMRVMVFASIFGIAQFLYQKILGGVYADPWERLPTSYLLAGYNTTYPIYPGSEVLKSNGILFLEPSFFSQYAALALIMELIGKRRIHFLALFGAGMLSAFSGTGFLVLLVASPFFFTKNIRLLLIVAFGAIVIYGFGGSQFGEALFSRGAEFSSRNSSGYARFISPYLAMLETATFDFRSFLIGNGPGAASLADVSELVNYPVLPKIAIEYGVICGGLFAILIGSTFFSEKIPLEVRGANAAIYFALSGALLQPFTVFLAYWGCCAICARRSQTPFQG